jgi:hypothetical protein
VVPLLVVSLFGEKLFDMLKALPAGAWLGIAMGVVAIGMTVWLVQRRPAR